MVKRNVLAGFRDVLLLPVTIVPRTVTFGVNAIVTGGSQAVNGLSMLNPQKWGAANGRAQLIDSDEKVNLEQSEKAAEDEQMSFTEKGDLVEAVSPQLDAKTEGQGTPVPKQEAAFDRLQLLVSLDIALELIHADRDSLKRTETFAKYPGKYGHKVRETIEEIFIWLLKAVGDRHIAPGFRM